MKKQGELFMRKIAPIFLLISFFELVLFSSCAPQISTKEVMESWLNHHKSELIKSWGPPHRITTDGQGGEIYIYEASSTSATTFNNIFGIELDNPITTINTTTEYRQFYIDKDGMIYYVRWGRN